MSDLMEQIADVARPSTDDDGETLTREQENKIIVNDPAVKEFIRLDRTYAQTIKPILERMSELKADIAKRYLVGTHFQGPDGTVYEISTQEWKSVRMEPVTINRTRFDFEQKGSLSEKRAKELGYELPAREK